MKKFLIIATLIFASAKSAYSQFCPSCIQNSAAVQNAQFNISSATIRGPLSVGSINLSSFTATSTVTAAVFAGSGTYLTNLNASQLLFGFVPLTAINGSYTNLTGVGTITAGVWHGSILGSQYGGTNANLVTSGPGSIPYFSSVGTMSALAPTTAGFLLQTNNTSAPSWTGAPQVVGTNITAIPMSNILIGSVPTTWLISDASISTISAAKVIGNIPGNATNITGNLSLLQLSTGTLVNTIVASSITTTGVTPGIWGGPSLLPQLTVASDGRITSISQSSFTIAAASITAGALPAGVTIGASQITAGALANTVIASSLTLTGVVPGSYGFASQTSSITVRADGRVSFANNVPIAINTSQINNGTLTAGVVVPAVNVQAGVLSGNVIASSVAATGISAGTYGTPTNTIQVVVGSDGRLSAVNQFAIPGLSTNTVHSNVDNAWTATQTFFSSVTIHGNLSAQNFTATMLSGNGSGLTNLDPTQISSGNLNPSVVASSVSIPYLTTAGSVTASAFFGDGSHLTGTTGETSYFGPAKTFGSSVTVATSLLAGSSVTASAFFGDASHLTGIIANQNTFTSSVTIINSSFSFTGSNGYITTRSSVTASAFFGDASHLTSHPCNTGAGLNSVLCQGDGTNTASGISAVVSGGGNASNANAASGNFCTIGGGGSNQCQSNFGTIGGGDSSTCSNQLCTVAGGENNHSTGNGSTVGGGTSNTASGTFSTIPGGTVNNATGNSSFASGFAANALSGGSFVWHSSASVDGIGLNNHDKVYDNGVETFNVYAAGGVFISSGSLNVTHSSVTALSYFGDGSHLTGISTNQNTFTSSVTVINSSFTFTGSNGYISTQSSVTASAFFGDASHLTSITAANISAGTLGASVIASSVAATGVSVGTFGSATQTSQIIVGVDGRLSSASNVTISGVPAASVPAAGVQAGTLGASVIASSVAATGVTVGSFGSATQAPTITVGVDGRLSAASAVTVTPAAGSITAGTLGATVIASSVAATGITSGTFGSAVKSLTATVQVDGRLSSLSSQTIAISTGEVSGTVQVSNGGTGATTASAARSNLSAAQSGANADITSLTGPLAINSTAAGNYALRVSSGAYEYDFYGSSSVIYAPTGGAIPIYQTRTYSGTLASPTAIADNVDIGGLSSTGYDGATYPAGSSAPGTIHYVSSGPWTTSSHGLSFSLFTTPINSITRAQRLTVLDSGNVGIGTTTPQSLLSVNGSADFGSDGTKSTFSATGGLAIASGSSITLTGANGFLTSQSSVTASAFFGNGYKLTSITVSSATTIPNTTFTNTTFGVAVATVTMTTRGFPVIVSLNATVSNTNANRTQSATILVDGGFTADAGSAALSEVETIGATLSGNISFSFAITGLSAGSHSFALCLHVDANTGSILHDATHYPQLRATELP